MKKLMFFIVLLLAGLLVTFRICLPPEKKQSFGPKASPATLRVNGRRGFLKQLGLTERQKQLLRRNRARFRRVDAQIDSQIEVKKTELENELDNETPEMNRVDSLCGQIGVLYGKKLKLRLSCKLEIERKILTPEQSAKVEGRREEGNFRPANLLLSK